MAMGTADGARSYRLLAVVLGIGVGIGAVASILALAAPKPPAPRAGELIVDFPPTVWGLLLLSPLLAGLAGLVIRRIREGSGIRHGWVAFVPLLAIALALTLILLSSHSPSSGTVSFTNGSPGGGGPSHNSTNNSSSGGSGGTGLGTVPGTVTFHFTAWMLLAVVVGVSACVAALAVPGILPRLLDRGAGRRTGPTAAERGRVREAVAAAGSALDRGEDPRETIVRLYLRLLAELDQRVGGTLCLTPTEIRSAILEPLGVARATAGELTGLFEEARYSTHRMGPESSGRCAQVVRAAELDLAQRVPSTA